MEPGRLVPCMAKFPFESVIAATPIGLFDAPPLITAGKWGKSLRTSGEGDQSGLTYLAVIWACPVQAFLRFPTATLYRIARFPRSTR